MTKFTRTCMVGLAILVTQIAVHAQTTGSLSGTITDQANAVVAGATVTLASNVAGAERSTTSDSNGNYDFQALLPGRYSISVEATGFKKSIAREIAVSVSLNAQVNIQLEVGLAWELGATIGAYLVLSALFVQRWPRAGAFKWAVTLKPGQKIEVEGK